MPLAHAEIDAAVAAGRRPIVVGGTGLYLRAALAELDLRPPPDPAIRERWTAALTETGPQPPPPILPHRAAALAENGPQPLRAILADRDGAAAERIPATDGHRLVRALELLDAGHKPP